MEDDATLSRGQYSCLVIVMGISSFFSILGSMAITRIAYLKLTSTYQRFVFMLSLMDMLNSFFLSFHQIVLPESDYFFPWAFGNKKTCSMAGFFLLFGSLATALYSSFLSLYFYFSIHASAKRDKQPEGIIGCWEWCGHVGAFLLPGGIAIAAATTGNIGVAPGLGLCVIESYECALGGVNEIDCVPSGNNGWSIPKDTNALRWAYFASFVVSAAFSFISTLLVYRKIHATLSGDDNGLPDEMKHRLRAVATQAVLYCGVFLNTVIWPFLTVAVSTDDNDTVYFLQLLASMIYPLQGAFNCFIYIRPRYQMLRAMYPDDSMIVVARVSLSKAGDPDEIEEVREQIYGDRYEPPSVESSVHSLASGLPNEVVFDPCSPMSKTSLVSTPADEDEMDNEHFQQKGKPRLADSDDDAYEETDDDKST